MADTPFGESMAPFRRSVRAFAEAGALVRRVGDDRAFWQYLQTLDQLPSASTFHPFAVTAQWPTEQDDARQPASPHRASHGSLAQMSARPAAQRQRLAVVNRSQALASPAVQPSTSRVDRRPALVVPPAPVETAAPGQAGMTAGDAWSVLPRIAQLLNELEPAGSPPAPATRGPGPSRSRSQAAQSRSRNQAAQSATPPRAALVSGVPQAGNASPSPEASTPPAPRSVPGGSPEGTASNQGPVLSLLADAVATLWQSESGAPQSPPGQTPASAAASAPPLPVPRAPSLLVGPATAAVQQAVDAGVSPAGREAGTLPSAAPRDDRSAPLADQVNHALIEQAWLRGVDLA